jgi:hypothetical protein
LKGGETLIESIFTGLTPDTPSNVDVDSYSLGTEFTTDVDGQILGVRIWSGGEVAASFGALYLWTSVSTGDLLASKSVATTPTTSGWQDVTFDSPVNVTAGSKYVAVWGPTDNYGATSLFFNGGDYTNDHLIASRGTFLVSSSLTFPSDTYNSTCYFIDVLFQFDSGNIDLVVQDANQSQTVDDVVLTETFELVIQDANQSQTVDDVVLTETFELVIQDANQSQTVDDVVLTETFELVIQDANQSQTVGVVTFASAELIRRLELQTMLEQFASNVYYQPPPNLSMAYPCVVYQRDNALTKFADNNPYSHEIRYQITVIDRDPDSVIPGKVAMLPKTLFNRYFAADGLNHNVYVTYY